MKRTLSFEVVPSRSFLIWWSNGLTKLSIPAWAVTLIFSIVFTAFYNRPLLQGVIHHLDGQQTEVVVLIFSLLFLLNHLIISLLTTRYTLKWWLLVLLLCASISIYFMSTYGVIIDKTMLQNAVETDFNEVKGLFNYQLLVALFLYFILPFWLYTKINIRWPQSKSRGVLLWSSILILNLVLISTLLMSNYQTFSSVFRNFREVKHLAVPFNGIDAVFGLVKNNLNNGPHTFQKIALDARQVKLSNKPTLIVLVVGETARADHFSINGYSKPTTPNLEQLLLGKAGGRLFNFTNVTSCGTATATSVPCMFSSMNRHSYDGIKQKYTENVLDVIQRTGVDTLWIDNNSGCKGVCSRVKSESITDCNNDACSDLKLVTKLKTKVSQFTQLSDHLVVLHQLGSHGPEYYKRSSAEQKKFTPECQTNQFQMCELSTIINAYDNSIYVTDEMLSQIVTFLISLQDTYNTALIYVSDHGESLGEDGVFLHGLPYAIAPEEQKHIPMVFWFSDDYMVHHIKKETCIEALNTTGLSHDDLFLTLLNSLDIKTQLFKTNNNPLAECFV